MTLTGSLMAWVLTAALAHAAPARAMTTIVVSPDGPVRSLAEAVRQAPAGARIVVRPGTYREAPIVIDKPLTIVGEGRPLVEPREESTLIRVTADHVMITGLALANVTASYVEDRAALRFDHVRGCVAEDLEVRDAPFGIYISQSSDCRVVHNVVRGKGAAGRALGNAIHLWSSSHVIVADNVVSNHRDGLYFEFVQDTTIERNTSAGNLRYGLHFMFSNGCVYRDNHFQHNGAGVAVMYTRAVSMERNEFRDNRGPTAYGLLLKEISESRLVGNRFIGNTVALLVEGGGHLAVSGNWFEGNGWAIKLMANSPQNRFEQNVFQANSFDMATNSRATDALVAGNWWDRYQGYDLNRDGLGDVAFRPVRLFSLLVASYPPSVILMRSTFVDLLDTAERTLPILTPETLVDASPLMRIPR
jgi:nitrous oxidase accessory protein